MAKPRIFISSTCYDLSKVRAELRNYLEEKGFEVLDSQSVKNFGVGPKIHSHTACLKEVENSNFLLLIIGGRYGGTYIASEKSITNEEFNKAMDVGVPIIICVDKEVFNLNSLYKKNPSADFSPMVNDKRVFHFIDYVSSGSADNWLHQYESIDDIKKMLTTQFAHYLFLFSQQIAKKSSGKQDTDFEKSFVKFPSILMDLPKMDQLEQTVFKNGLRELHNLLSKILSSDLKQDSKNEQMKCLWVIGKHGKLDTLRWIIQVNNDIFKSFAWGNSKGQRVFNQMRTFGIVGEYDDDGVSEQWINLKFSSENSESHVSDALLRYIKDLIYKHGENDAFKVFLALDMRMYSSH